MTGAKNGLSGIFDEVLPSRASAAAIRLVDGGGLTFSQLQGAIEALSKDLAASGVRPGDVVSIVMPNSVEFVIAFLAVTWIRAISAPLNPAFTEKEFGFFLEDQGAVAILDLPGERANRNARNAAAHLNIPVWDAAACGNRSALSLSRGESLGSPVPATPLEPEIDVALFVHTSGTTSRPKGVPLTHHNLMASIGNIRRTYAFDENDCSLLVMPLFHVHGLMAGLLAPLAAGSSVAIPRSGKFSASAFWKDIVQCKATWYTAVPTIHQILLARYETEYPKENPPQLRFIRSCSAPLAPAVLEEMEKKFGAPVLEAYAMTEAAHQMASNPLPENGPHKPGSVGKGQNVDIAIFSEKGRELKPLQIGEICVRGENLTQGYRNNPDANQESFSGGWFHTGDQGYLDADGYLFITGRIKEMINRGGEKISPNRIDEVLLAHPGVAAAVSFAAPDPTYGEEVNAAIILKPETRLTVEELTEFCRGHLSGFELPKRFFFADSLPVTGSGKIQRKSVADHFLAHP